MKVAKDMWDDGVKPGQIKLPEAVVASPVPAVVFFSVKCNIQPCHP